MMNRDKRPLLPTGVLALLLAVLLAGCSADTDTPQGEPVPVAFSLAFNKPSTRSTLDNIWPDNTEISVSDGTTIYTYKTGANSSAGASGEATELLPVNNAFYWTINDPSLRFSAWYPAATGATGGITVAENQGALAEAAYNAYDLLYSSPIAVAFRETVALKLHHQMARVIVIVSTSLTENKETVTSVSFGGGHLGLTGTITTFSTTGENGSTVWSVADEGKSITMRTRPADTDTERYIYAYECMLPPQKNDTKVNLVSVATSGAAEGNRTYNYQSTFDLKAGYLYTYNLVLSEQGTIKLATVRVEDWDGTPVDVDNTATIPDNNYPD